MSRHGNRAARPSRFRRRGPRKRLKFLLLTQLTCSGCFSATPFQSARVTEPGQGAGHLSVQRSQPRDPDGDQGWTMVEGGTRLPLDDGNVDLGVHAAFISWDPTHGSDNRIGGALFGLGPKFELIPDVLAIETPVRFAFAWTATLHTAQFYPRAILSLPVASGVELNLSATKFFFPAMELEAPWGYSAGLALGPRGGTIIRPEIGVLVYPEGDDMIQFGIAITPEITAPGKATPPEAEPEGPVYGPFEERTPH